MTFENSQQIDLLPMELPTLMSSRAASPARTSASRDAASDFPVSVPVSLRRSPVWLANFDHSSFCWRTSQSRSEEHTSELQSLMRISYAVFCLNKKKKL